MNQRIVGIVFAVIIAVVVARGIAQSPEGPDLSKPASSEPATYRSKTVSDMYPAPWRYEFNTEITRTLVAAKVSACGIYRYRVSRDSNSEYLVYCSRDNKHWLAYLVWPNISKTLGPYQPDLDLP